MNTRKSILLLTLGLLLVVVALALRTVLAKPAAAPVEQDSTLHPTFALLDADGSNVLDSGEPVSTVQTCGQCHDAGFIAGHSFHADLGLSEFKPTDPSLDTGVGQFGKWDPFAYRFLSRQGDELLDLGTPEWLALFGARQAGGGPALTSREGEPLASLSPSATDPEASALDPATGDAVPWDWSQSGAIEMNCFLCHLETPDNAARAEAIQNGDFAWANTATLLNSGIVNKTVAGWVWMPSAFDGDGKLRDGKVTVQDPTNENCAQCHTMAHTEEGPLVLEACDAANAPTGEVISGQRISDSGMNIQDKETLARSWDVHAERELQCTDCHFSLNNPTRQLEVSGENPTHLIYDPRRLEIGEYLKRPDHNLARGQSAQYNVASELKGTMRRCESCHDAQEGHSAWLPYVERHMDEVACETCHIPQVYAPAAQSYDWTVVKLDGAAQTACRGVVTGAGDATSSSGGGVDTVNDLVSGYQPVLLQRTNVDGGKLLAPYNLITAWYWVYDDANGNTRPVRQADLQAAYLDEGNYAPEVLATFDENGDAALDASELRLDDDLKGPFIATRLGALGLSNVRIQAQTLPFSINHGVARGEDAINDCETCHTRDSRLAQPIKLADSIPGGTLPQFVEETNVSSTGEMIRDASGALYYQPVASNDALYVFGSSSVDWVDRFGAIFFALVLVGAAGHGTMRYVGSNRKGRGGEETEEPRTDKIYLYGRYERFWHWLQTILIVLLLFTGLIIHRPDIFGIFAFRNMVLVHNVLAAILVINAALSLFYHLTTGHIRQFIPRPYGFFDDAIVQARYYTRGIFKGDPHPFDKTPDRKMNPLQQVTYFGILMVLLPLQTLTGILMWGVQRWPQVPESLGGLTFLAPLHTLVAWVFAAFIVGHVYLVTTGRTPLESMRGMVTGWEDVETHEPAPGD
jgi:thiosulfate reductase cytochrome b subunit